MFAIWCRSGNFFKVKDYKGYPSVTLRNSVSYYNTSPCVIISKIEVIYRVSGITEIWLHASPYSYNKLKEACKKIFNEQDTVEYDDQNLAHQVKIKLDKPNFSSIIALFEYINKEYNDNGYIEFPKVVFKEIQQIEQHLENYSFNSDYQHQISEESFINSHTNPALFKSKALVSFLKKYELKEPPLKVFKKFLISGENTNQVADGYTVGDAGWPPLFFALYRWSNVYLELLLAYGANPFLRYGSENLSTVEMAKRYYFSAKCDVILKSMTKIEAPITRTKFPDSPTIEDVKIHSDPTRIVTQLGFSNKEALYTVIFPAKKLSSIEKENIFSIFNKFFEPAPESKKTAREIFEEDIADPDNHKFVEAIYDAKTNKIIGFNLFEIILLPNRKDHVIFHCVYALIEPAYRGYKIMPLLSFRNAYSLQALNTNLKVAVFYSAIHYNSVVLSERFLTFPKYQPEHVVPLVKDILKEVYGDDVMFHDDMTCFIRENLRVKGANYETGNNLLQKLYIRHILGIPEKTSPDDIPTRAAPILFYIGDDSLHEMQNLLKILGADFNGIMLKMAGLMVPFVKHLIPINGSSKEISSIKNDYVFWFDKNVLVDSQNDEFYSQNMRAKL